MAGPGRASSVTTEIRGKSHAGHPRWVDGLSSLILVDLPAGHGFLRWQATSAGAATRPPVHPYPTERVRIIANRTGRYELRDNRVRR